MSQQKKAAAVIEMLQAKNYYAECPCCQKPHLLRDVGLFYLDKFTDEAEQLYKTRCTELEERKQDLHKRCESISQRSEVLTKATNIGSILERLAPSLKAFRFERNDCRSLFEPIDYLIFEGLTQKKKVERIVFVDVKTGDAKLNPKQKRIKELVGQKQVRWARYNQEG